MAEPFRELLGDIGGQLQEKIRPVAQGVERPVGFFPATGLRSIAASVPTSRGERASRDPFFPSFTPFPFHTFHDLITD